MKFVPGEGAPKITVIASVKASKKAVERNGVKRILRDELRKHIDKLKPGNYAIIVKASAVKAESAELRSSLSKSLSTGKMLSNK